MRSRLPAVAAAAAAVTLALAVALVGTTSIADAALPPRPAPTPDPSVTAAAEPGGDPGVSMTIVNWGKPTSIVSAKHKAWAHLSANAAPIQVTVRVDPHQGRYQGYLMTFTTPDAFQGPEVQYCADEFTEFTAAVQCTFQVPISRGPNRIELEFHTGSDSDQLHAHGIVYGGDLRVSGRMQALDSTGQWQDLVGNMFTAPGTRRTAIRYVLINSGDIPVRPAGTCSDRLLQPGAFTSCVLRGPRPMYALAGPYHVPVVLEDPAGGIASLDINGVFGVPGILHGPNG